MLEIGQRVDPIGIGQQPAGFGDVVDQRQVLLGEQVSLFGGNKEKDRILLAIGGLHFLQGRQLGVILTEIDAKFIGKTEVPCPAGQK